MAEAVLPCVRKDLRRTPRVVEGRTFYIFKDPKAIKYFQFGELEAWIMERFDGTRTFMSVAAELKAETGARTTAAALQTFYAKLRERGLTERTIAEKSHMLMERLRRDRKERLKSTSNTLFRMRFSFGDPDQLFNRMLPHIQFFWTRGFVVFSALLFGAYAYLLADNWNLFMTGFHSLYEPSTYTLGFVLTLYGTIFVIFMLHEFGHGLTCKRFGGEVHEIGMMLLYFMPAFFCNVSDAYTFEKRAHRLWVTFAGGWIQLLIAALAAVVWAFTEPGTTIHSIAFVATLIGGGLSLLLNYNPLLPLDGYYAMIDITGITNLRERAMELLGAETNRRIFRIKSAAPQTTPREYRILLIYGILATTYTVFVLSVIGHWAGGLLVSKFGGWGWVVIAFLVWKITRKLRPRLARLARSWVAEHMPAGPRRQWILRGAAATTVVLALTFVVPWTVRVRGSAVVEASARTWLRPPELALVASVLVSEGDRVQAGQELARLRNPDLEIDIARARAHALSLERELNRARMAGDAAAVRQTELHLAAATSEQRALELRLAALTLRAPYAATVATPRLNELVGARVKPGDSLIELWGAGPLRVRIALAQRNAGEVAVGDRVRMRFPSHARAIWSTQVVQVGSAARDQQVEALAPLGTDDGTALLPGMVGRARIAVDRTSVADATMRGLRRLVRTERFL